MNTETFGQRLKRLRERAGLTQAELASAASVPIGTLRGAEYDRREPLVSTANRLAAALGVTLDELVGTVPVVEGVAGVRPPTPAEAKPRGRPRKDAEGPAPEPAVKKRPQKKNKAVDENRDVGGEG